MSARLGPGACWTSGPPVLERSWQAGRQRANRPSRVYSFRTRRSGMRWGMGVISRPRYRKNAGFFFAPPNSPDRLTVQLLASSRSERLWKAKGRRGPRRLGAERANAFDRPLRARGCGTGWVGAAQRECCLHGRATLLRRRLSPSKVTVRSARRCRPREPRRRRGRARTPLERGAGEAGPSSG